MSEALRHTIPSTPLAGAPKLSNLERQIPSHRDFLVPCKPKDEKAADDACTEKFIRSTGRLLFRRPLDNAKVAEFVAKAHEADLAKQGEYGVNYKSYWVDEKAGKVFCLVEAPDAATAARVHKEAHGLVADHIFEVSEGS